VSASIGSLKVAVGFTLTDTPVALGAGVFALTKGRVVSPATAVVKLQVKGAASGLPCRSLTPVLREAV